MDTTLLKVYDLLSNLKLFEQARQFARLICAQSTNAQNHHLTRVSTNLTCITQRTRNNETSQTIARHRDGIALLPHFGQLLLVS